MHVQFLFEKMINGELYVDNFAGGGGASTGIELATGKSVDIAINHDPEAIKLHKANHPSTKHYCENVWAVDPIEACNGHPVGLAWFSPDCKHFSKAKGGKPKDKNIRGLAWVALRWAGLVRPRVIMLENVEEFKTWGPLNRNHHPIRSKKGQTFRKFVNQLKALGYAVEFKELVAADYGAPTKRKRFFLIARCDGKPIVWPQPTHAPRDSMEVKAGLLQPYVGAYTQIDFSLPCPSIFETAAEIQEKYGKRANRPLKPKTLQRIARGLQKFVFESDDPFIIQCKYGNMGQSIEEPLGTITTVGSHLLVEPYMVQIGQTGFTNDRSKDVREPLTTIVSKNEHCLVKTKLVEKYGKDLRKFSINPVRYPAYCNPNDMNKLPFADPDMETDIQQQLICPSLIQYHSYENEGVRGQDVEEPIMTVDGSNRYGLVTSFLHQYYNGGYQGAGKSLDNPLPTITAIDHNSICATTLIQMNNNCDGRDITEPIPTITAGDGHFGEVRAFLMKYYGQGIGQKVKDPLDTVTSKDRFGLVTIKGVDYQIVDIGLRMLEPKELYGCQGFPDDYIIDHDFTGHEYLRSEQVKRCGNAVPPPFAVALVKANLSEACIYKRMPNMRIDDSNEQLSFAI